ncbi:glycosyltransferase family 4 protein [Acidiferrimicrobium sp. IK]|uniref:glycosyltransferase family 4 protein n=1 Tax=Acidiferrimicrobium sp. IK TaxID=2871700 RepID=UPI0021CB9390|nr:glycosyltransferase family 4 protein [Acidiferrimicrobium sp. IK]MCU4185561.1 glycosyltransferase family 4 protein [Acidiferrimicrobium sp. IK]
MSVPVERIDQFVPGFAPFDAIGSHVLELRRLLRARGFPSDIWGEHIDPRVGADARPYRECPPRSEGRVLLYQLSTGSPMAAWLAEAAAAGQPVWANYHNITPARYFARWEPEAAASMVTARQEMAALAPVAARALAVSGYNETELIAAGYPSTATAPLLVDLDRYHDDPDPAVLARLQRRRDGGGATWLFVGRIAPNKCQHHLIGALALYRRFHDPRARLTLVGGVTSPRYLHSLRRLSAQLGVTDAVEILDGLPTPALLAHFATADVFVCMSEHEGFCVPVLEAFELGVPVVAYRAAALPETVADAGVLLDSKDPLEVADAVAGLLADEARRAGLVKAGRARASAYALPVTSARTIEVIEGWLEGGGPGPLPA